MVIERGEIWWAALSEPRGSEPGYSCPVLVVQSDDFNRSRISTVIAVVITSNIRLAEAPSYGLPISAYAPSSTGAQAYSALARELLTGDGVAFPE